MLSRTQMRISKNELGFQYRNSKVFAAYVTFKYIFTEKEYRV